MEWIKVTDRLPEESGKKYGEEYLVYVVTTTQGVKNKSYSTRLAIFKDGSFYSQYITPDRRYPQYGSEVTHWQKIKRPKK